jgi:hypothetical protein
MFKGKGKGNVFLCLTRQNAMKKYPLHAMKKYWGRGGTAPHLKWIHSSAFKHFKQSNELHDVGWIFLQKLMVIHLLKKFTLFTGHNLQQLDLILS